MFSSEQYHAKAAEYLEVAAKTECSNKACEFGDLARSYTVLADNEEWLEHNFDKMVHAPDKDRLDGDALAAEEEHILSLPGSRGYYAVEQHSQKTSKGAVRQRGLCGRLVKHESPKGKGCSIPAQA